MNYGKHSNSKTFRGGGQGNLSSITGIGAGNKPCSAATRKKQQKGFTLAEVLITLGIIGVVAAMTMPTLMNKTKNKELHTAFLKTYSELNQVAALFVADNGISVSEYSASDKYSKVFEYYKGRKNLSGSMVSADEDGIFKPYYTMNTLNGKSYSGGANSQGRDSSFFCDNSSFSSSATGALYVLNDFPDANSRQNGPVICVDVNGKKKPNRYGIDYFMFIFTVDGRVLPVGQEHKNNPAPCASSTGSCKNFNNIGPEYCSNKVSDISKNTSCAYYALTNTHPTKEGKDYWNDFLGEVYSR